MNSTSQGLYKQMIPENQYRYWYSLLSRKHKEMYDKIVDGYFRYSEAIVLNGTFDELKLIIRAIDKDIPETFFVSIWYGYIEHASPPASVTYYPIYRFDRNETLARYNEALQKSSDFISEVSRLDDRCQKRDRLYGYLTSNTVYEDPQKARAHEFYYVLAKNSGVCEGISKAAKFLSDRIDLDTIVVFGKAQDGGGHAWNLVDIGSAHEHMDATYGLHGNIRYRSMNSKQAKETGHFWHCTLPNDDIVKGLNTMVKQNDMVVTLKSRASVRINNGQIIFPRNISGTQELEKPVYSAIFDYDATKHRMGLTVYEAHNISSVRGLNWQILYKSTIGDDPDALDESGVLLSRYWLVDHWDEFFGDTHYLYSDNEPNPKQTLYQIYPLRNFATNDIPQDNRTLYIGLLNGTYTQKTYQYLLRDISDRCFGVEIEGTGITQEQAAYTVAEATGGTVALHDGRWKISTQEGTWMVTTDTSVAAFDENGTSTTNRLYMVEVVSPKLKYKSINTLLNVVRKLQLKGFSTNASCGLHVHIDVSEASREAGSLLLNLLNLTYTYQDLFYAAFAPESNRMHYCKKLDESMLQQLNADNDSHKLSCIREHWYKDYQDPHRSRYQMLNLHSYFMGKGVEFRLFNGTLHAGIIRSNILFCLGLVNLASRIHHLSLRALDRNDITDRNKMRRLLDDMGIILNDSEMQNPRHHILSRLPTLQQIAQASAS